MPTRIKPLTIHPPNSIHKTIDLNGIPIDINIADLIQLLWDKGYITSGCCESAYKDLVWIQFTGKTEAINFVSHLFEVSEGFQNSKGFMGAEIRKDCLNRYSVHFPLAWKNKVISASVKPRHFNGRGYKRASCLLSA